MEPAKQSVKQVVLGTLPFVLIFCTLFATRNVNRGNCNNLDHLILAVYVTESGSNHEVISQLSQESKKKALRTITFSQYDSPSSPLFKSLQVIKFYDLVTFHIATFMYKFHNQLLPTAFHSFFTKVTNIHKYNTRLAAKQSYYLPFVRTNYGKFNTVEPPVSDHP